MGIFPNSRGEISTYPKPPLPALWTNKNLLGICFFDADGKSSKKVESHGIPIRKKITKTKHKSKWYEGILDTLVAPFIPPSHSQQSVCHRQKTPAKIKKKWRPPVARLRQGRQNAHFPNPEKNPPHRTPLVSLRYFSRLPGFTPQQAKWSNQVGCQLNPYAQIVMSIHKSIIHSGRSGR